MSIKIGKSKTHLARSIGYMDTYAAPPPPTYVSATRIATINNPIVDTTGYFGYNLNTDGTSIIIGAYGNDGTFSGSGAAYKYSMTGSYQGQYATPDVNAGGDQVFDGAGTAVDVDGAYAVIGVPQEDDGTTSNTGVVHVVNTADRTLARTIVNPLTSAGGLFGRAVSISGNYAIIGSEGYSSGAGIARIYDVTTGVLMKTITNPASTAGDYFGSAVSISGNYLAIGSYANDVGNTDTGTVYVYKTDNGTWSDAYLVHTIQNPNSAGTTATDQFGWSVRIEGNILMAGAKQEDNPQYDSGSVYVFNVTTAQLIHTFNDPNIYSLNYSDNFGWSVDTDGIYAVVGSPLTPNSSSLQVGGAHVYNIQTGAYVLSIPPEDTTTAAQFGRSVAIYGDKVIVGAPYASSNRGRTYVYQLSES